MIVKMAAVLFGERRWRRKIGVSLFVCTYLSITVAAQESVGYTLKAALAEVKVSAYEQGNTHLRTATPIAVLDGDLISKQQPQSALQAINAIPGVRMEERSPGSYRLNIRGSSMRAPFGVRNVKVYYNGIPFTEPGGTSYINQFGLLNFRDAEIVKGPGSSMYGAGTGGVMLLQHLPKYQNEIALGYSFGSYGSHNFFADINLSNENSSQHLAYQQNLNTGFRQQSRLNRAVFNWDATYKLNNRQKLQTTLIYGDLYYQTPGALTFQEYNADRKAARPASGNFPSAQKAKAAIEQQTIVSGITLMSGLANGFSNKTTAYAAFTNLENAAIRNYSYNKQPHTGVRTLFQVNKQAGVFELKVNLGAELQTGASDLEVYDNNNGRPSGMQRQETVQTTVGFGFAQAQLEYKGWELLLGSSFNNTALRYRQSFPISTQELTQNYTGIWAPRISLSKLLHKNIFVYGLLSKGFSPPTTDELLPSGSAFNQNLQPENGRNYELGIRYQLAHKIFLELNAYYFRLDNTIVQRRDSGGGDYYLNAGFTKQPGLELSGQYTLGVVDRLQSAFKFSYAYQPYTYGSFLREDEDFTGNALSGLSAHNVFTGVELTFRRQWNAHVNYYYNSNIPLSDANIVFGKETHIMNCKLGRQITKGKYSVSLFAGIDNLLNEKYSLGFDINAAGSRYYNAAPDRNYYCQLVITIK